MRPPKGAFPKARMAAVFAVLGIGVGLMLHCNSSDEEPARVSRQAATQIMDAEHARAAASTAIVSAKSTARKAEREAETALFRVVEARAPARIVGAEAPVVERMQLDSIAIAALDTLVQRKETVIVAQDLRITADSIELLATSNAFHALERAKEPRCGRRCGIVLGVGSVVLAAVAVGQVRRAFR